MRPLALKWRLSIPVALAAAAAMAVMCVLAYDSFNDLVLTQTDRSLVSTARAVQTVIDAPSLASDRPAHIRGILAAMSERPQDATRPRLVTRTWMDHGDENAFTIGSDADAQCVKAALQTMSPPAQGQSSFFDIDTPKDDYRGVWMRVDLAGGPANVVVAQWTGVLYDELHELLWGFLLTTLGVVIVVVVTSGMLIVLGLRPIRRTAERLAGITAGNLGQLDWPAHSVPAELETFVDTVAKMLARLDAAMQQQKTFIADVSHELRTPIAVAKSTLQVAEVSDHSPAEYRQVLRDATNDLRRLEHLVDDLLTLARLDESLGSTPFQEVDLTQLLATLAESFRSRLAPLGGRLHCDLAPARVHGEASQLQRLFSNLLDNALRHGPPGGEIRLTIRTQASDVEILILDQGGRIASKDLPRLFDRFYRADDSRSQSTGGTGLGLAIAKAIVLRHGGDIAIRSDPATGTCACVRLPAV